MTDKLSFATIKNRENGAELIRRRRWHDKSHIWGASKNCFKQKRYDNQGAGRTD